MRTPHSMLTLIGCGLVFENVAAGWKSIESERTLNVIALPSTDTAARDVASLLEKLDPSVTAVFIAIDQQALNHARLDIYGQTRLRGFKSETLIHPSAVIEESVKLGENCWIGAGVRVGHDVSIGNNTLIGEACRIEAHAKISANCWLGSGAGIGAYTTLGVHCVIGRDVKLNGNLQIGRHCSIDVPGYYSDSLTDGTFIDPLFPLPVKIYGMNPNGRVGITPVPVL